MANELAKRGEKLVTGGTDTHLVMWDLRPHGISGGKMQEILDLMNITTNKNSVVGDTS
jgi:glycine hydroxymethyltransferase